MIGVVTPYKVSNYGTKLQAYAMQKLFEQYGGSEIINFLTRSDMRWSAVSGKMFSLDIWSHKLIEMINKRRIQQDKELYENLMLRKKAINSFDVYLEKSQYVEGNKALNGLISKYDYIVCGSDQLWAPRNVIADYFTLSWVPSNIVKFSFSASFGLSTIPKHLRRKYTKFLGSYAGIAMREVGSKSIVQDLLEKEVTVTLDPTLMIDVATWKALALKGKKYGDGKYVFCYFLGTNPAHRKWAQQLAKKIRAKIIIIPHFIEYCQADNDIADIEIFDANPTDFLRLIMDAQCVVTDSFHATVFSVLFQKKVAIFERFSNAESRSTNSRIHSIVNSLGIQNALIQEELTLESFLQQNIDFLLVEKKLEELKKASFAYIEGMVKKSGREDSL